MKKGHEVERVTDDAGETVSAMVKLARDIDESASDVIGNEWPFMVWPAFQAVLTCFQCAHVVWLVCVLHWDGRSTLARLVTLHRFLPYFLLDV